ncbi:MAG: AAA family ATPase [Mariprofundus sp.]
MIDLWFAQKAHKPLVLRGARQVGKSTLIRLFAEQRNLELVELNFERNPEYADLFASNDPNQTIATMRLVHYWAREAASSSAKLNYVIEGDKPVAVEVKAGKSGSLKSLHLFIKEKQSPLAVRLNADVPSIMNEMHVLPDGSNRSYQLLSLPLYMAGQVRQLISS